MQPMEDQNCELEFQEVYNVPKSNEDLKFDQIIMAFQEIVIDPDFERVLTDFMKHHWAVFEEGYGDKEAQTKVFHLYRAEIQKYIENNIVKKVPDFDWAVFGHLLESRKNLVDEQILDTLMSLQEVESFKLFIQDYRTSFEEEELFKVMTIKSNKISENKKVKGKDNIFSGDNHAGMFEKGLKAPGAKKQSTKQTKDKTEDELMVRDLILTVRPFKKG